MPIHWLIRSVRKEDGFARNVALLMSGTAIAQVLSFAVAPVLTRLFTPAMFGTLGVFTSLAALISVAATLRYELAIVLPREDSDAANLLALATLITVTTGVLTLLVVPFAGGWIAEQVSLPEANKLLWWLPVSVIALGFYQSFNYWSSRRKRFSRLSISRVAQSASVAGAQASAGLLSMGSGGLVGGQTVGQAIAAGVLGYQVWREDGKLIRSEVSWRRMWCLASEYKEFPLYSSSQTLVNTLAQGAPSFLLAYFFSPVAVGYYLIANRILRAPVQLVGQSIRQVFYPKAAEAYVKGSNTHVLFVRFTLALALVASLPVLLVLLYGPEIFVFVFGKQWMDAGHFARWLSVWLYFSVINPPATALIQVHRRQRTLLGYETALAVTRIGVLVVGGLWLSALETVALFSVISALFNIVLITWTFKMTRAAGSSQS